MSHELSLSLKGKVRLSIETASNKTDGLLFKRMTIADSEGPKFSVALFAWEHAREPGDHDPGDVDIVKPSFEFVGFENTEQDPK